MVLVYGLVVAPVVHVLADHAGGLMEQSARAQGHGHSHGTGEAEEPGSSHREAGHPHEHGPTDSPEEQQAGHEHGWGSVEHLGAVAVARGEVLAPVVRWVRLAGEVFREPLWRPVAPVRRTAMPQGP
jgi:hypothetical protein